MKRIAISALVSLCMCATVLAGNTDLPGTSAQGNTDLPGVVAWFISLFV